MKNDFVDYYKILSVSPKASAEEIKRAWRRKMMKFHPDHHLAEEARYEEISREINRAYFVLSNRKRRRSFDEARWRRFANSDDGNSEFFSFGTKIALTVLAFCLSVFFFAIPPWADCESAFWRYLFSGRGEENLGNPVVPALVVIFGIFAGMFFGGKCLGERAGAWTFLSVFSLFLACVKSLVVPLHGHGAWMFPLLFLAGVICVFRTYGERKNPVAGLVFRVVGLVASVATYRCGELVFGRSDEIVSGVVLLVLAAYLIAGVSAALSSGSE